MVYVASDGTVHNGPRPWDMKRVKDTFWSVVSALELFVQTLIPFPIPGTRDRALRYRSSNSSAGSSRSGPGSGGSRGGSSYRPTGGFRTMSDIRPPPPAFGGCSGGACGM